MKATDKPQSLRVFLCHSAGDKPAVRELYQRLCAEGIDAWLDEEKLLPGQDWQHEIPKAVRASDVVIVCLSRNSITRAGYVQREIKFALDVADEQPEGAIFLIPAKLEECEVPERLSRWQWVSLHEAKGYERLMRALRVRASELGVSLSPEQPRSTPPHPAPMGPSSDRAELRRKLAEHFNREELHTLCFDLGIEHENLPDTKDGMARELVAHCERHGRISDLVAACKRLRPRVEWGTTIDTVTQPAVPPARPPITGELTMIKLHRFGGIEFVCVPKGKFIMGSKDDNKVAYPDEKPQHTVEIPYDYWIARYPVTNDQFAAFVGAAKYTYEMTSDWKNRANHPVVNVSWHDAMAYCKWLNEKLREELGDLVLRLPTEAEWEKAARGEHGNEWPWGNEFDAAKCNSYEDGKSGTTPVGTYSPQGDSPYGAADMAGNVWEWCHSICTPYPYKADDGREKESSPEFRVARGGSWSRDRRSPSAPRRSGHGPGSRNDLRGFRVVVAPKLS
jgi:formylglycine-generating enzyme required for sulfatase activity